MRASSFLTVSLFVLLLVGLSSSSLEGIKNYLAGYRQLDDCPDIGKEVPKKMQTVYGVAEFYHSVNKFVEQHPKHSLKFLERMKKLKHTLVAAVKSMVLGHAEAMFKAAGHLNRKPTAKHATELFLDSLTVAQDGEKFLNVAGKVVEAGTVVLHVHNSLAGVFTKVLCADVPGLSEASAVAEIVLKFIKMYNDFKKERMLHKLKICIDRDEAPFDYPLRELFSYLQREGDAALIQSAIHQAFSIAELVASEATKGVCVPGGSTLITVIGEALAEGLALSVGLPNKIKLWWGGYAKIIAADAQNRKHKSSENTPLLQSEPDSPYNQKVYNALRQLLSREATFVRPALRYLKYCKNYPEDAVCGDFFAYQYEKYQPYIDELSRHAISYDDDVMKTKDAVQCNKAGTCGSLIRD